MRTIGERIKFRREQLQMSQDELAKKLGYKSRSSINKIEIGCQNLTQSKIKAIADALETTPSYIMGWSADIGTPNILPLPETYEIPLLGNIACGTPILANENVEEMVSVPYNITADFCLRCAGDSMTGARIYDGDIVYIKQQDDVEDGQIAAVLIDDEATLKRVYRDGENLVLQAENPAYKPMIYTKKDAKAIRIIGLAVAFLSRVK